MGTAIVAWTRGGTPVRVGVFVDVYMGAEDARAVKPFETPGRTPYTLYVAHYIHRIWICYHETKDETTPRKKK